MIDLKPESLYKKIFDNALVAIGIMNTEGKFILVNNTWCKQLSYTPDEAGSLTLKDILVPEDIEERLNNLQKIVNEETENIHNFYRYRRKDGSIFWTNLSITSIRNDAGEVIAVLNIFQDIDTLIKNENKLKDINLNLESVNEHIKNSHEEIQRKNEELQLAYSKLEELARTDVLTGLPNRMQLQDRLLTESNRTSRTKQDFCICICDIDDFKQINDNYGHNIGDIVLKDIAGIFRKCTRLTDFVGRWGGEEFMLILPETTLADAMPPMERVRSDVESHQIIAGDKTFSATITMGFSCFYPDSKLEDVIKQADLALYAGKKSGKNLVIRYTKQLEAVHSIPNKSNHR